MKILGDFVNAEGKEALIIFILDKMGSTFKKESLTKMKPRMCTLQLYADSYLQQK